MKPNERPKSTAAAEARTNVLRFPPRPRVERAEDAALRFWPWPGAWPQGGWPQGGWPQIPPPGDDDDPGPAAA